MERACSAFVRDLIGARVRAVGYAVVAVASAVLIAGAGCSSGLAPYQEREIGPEGGVVETNAARLEIPAGALPGAVTITMTTSGATVVGQRPVAHVVTLGPAGLVLEAPAVLRLKSPSSRGDGTVFAATGVLGEYVRVASETVDGGHETSINYLTSYFVGESNVCGADLQNSVEHCGECGNQCPSENGQPSCVQGRCIITCDDGRGQCNGEPETPRDDDGDGVAVCDSDALPECGDGKVSVCHIPPGSPARAFTICVAREAVADHVAHGDGCGICTDSDGCEAPLLADMQNCGACGSVCDPHAVCEEEGGGTCLCSDGYQGDGISCVDIDECDTGAANCPDGATCDNLPGTFVCTCPVGFVEQDGQCIDVDECAVDSDRCHDDATCINTDGAYRCVCDQGYEGSGFSCEEVDECARGLHSCDTNATCTNFEGSYACECNNGFAGGGFFCDDVDECSVPGVCDDNAACRNVTGGYVCTCKPGYAGDGRTCTDRNECQDGGHDCDVNADCTDTVGGFTCACRDGYVGNGTTCDDIDECAEGLAACPEDTECVNSPGSYWCDDVATCTTNGSSTVCTCPGEQNECATGTDRCGTGAVCTDTPACYTCTCPTGYQGDGVSCEDVDECAIGQFDCGPDGMCSNTDGGYECLCPAGYAGDGRSCADVDECATGIHKCDAVAACDNTAGGYTCSCPQGYTGTGKSCTDVDECATGAHRCDANADCTNTPGNYECTCGDGWTGTGFVCEDEDECALATDRCDDAAACSNTRGGYTCTCSAGMAGDGFACSCPDGYERQGKACVDIDECARSPGICGVADACVNRAGGYACSCPAGYENQGDKCVGINPCARETDACDADARCVFDAKHPGSYTCACAKGYAGDGFTCTDVDECGLGLDDCADEGTCTNTDGGFDCTCPQGWSGTGRACAPPGDPDECADGTHGCDTNADCENRAPGYACICRKGSQGDGFSCTDVDECSDGTADCGPNGTCRNTDGGYTCSCEPGYKDVDGFCVDVDECAQPGACPETASCVNNIGSYSCECKSGYSGGQCNDIDECAIGTAECGDHAVCVNNPGGYDCNCTDGYAEYGGVCVDVDECATDADTCDTQADCINTPGAYVCECRSGFAGDGHFCTDVDECADGAVCGANSRCINVVGGYECQCDDGTQGADCVKAPTCAVDVVASGDHTCAIFDTGSVRCWGANYYGELGYAHTAAVGDDEPADSGGDVQLGDTAVQVAAGVTHNCALLASNAVMCWGRNRYGQLGYGHVRDIGDDETPLDAGAVDLGDGVAELAAGGEHTCARYDTGQIRCWGLNVHGQLGLGTTENIGDDEPASAAGYVSLGAAASQVVASRDHTCALLVDGQVRCWGRNDWGQLGYGHTDDIGDDETPADSIAVPVGGTVVALAAGWYHTCAVLDTGAVRCWGLGAVGQLGYGNTEDIGDDEPASAAGDVDLGGEARSIEAGVFHTCALMVDGGVRCWGYGERGRLGYAQIANVGDDEPPADVGDVHLGGEASVVATGFAHSCALVDACSVRCWGDGQFGQLGYGNDKSTGTTTPASVGDVPTVHEVDECKAGTDACGAHTTCVNTIGGYQCLCDAGYSGDGVSSGFADGAGNCHDVDECSVGGVLCADRAVCVNLAGGYECVCPTGYVGDGQVCADVDECANSSHRCGTNATCSNTDGGYDCTCAGGFAGNGYVCSDIDECGLGIAGCHVDANCSNRPGSFSCTCKQGFQGDGVSCSDVDECATGTNECVANAACANTVGDYTCTCTAGYSGNGYSSCQEVPTSVAAGGDHSCAILSHSDVVCWGANSSGQLGYGTTTASGDDELPSDVGRISIPGRAHQIAVGDLHTCALSDAGLVRCWGDGAAGRLGYASIERIGDDETLTTLGPVNLGGVAVQVEAGGAHTCALLETGALVCWGAGFNGALGYGDKQNVGDDEVPAKIGVVDVGGAVVQVAAGMLHTCALLDKGDVRCWGHGAFGQLGYGNTASVGDTETPASVGVVQLSGLAVKVAAGDYHTCALLDTGAVQCWGSGSDGRLGYASTASVGDIQTPTSVGTVDLGAAAVSIAAGAKHTCALLADGTVRCWGSNASGQLGLVDPADIGDNEAPGSQAALTFPSPAVSVTAGRAHSCVLTADGDVYCWGTSSTGQLGQAATQDSSTPMSVSVTARYSQLAAGAAVHDVTVYQAVGVPVVRARAAVDPAARNAPIVAGADAIIGVSITLDAGFAPRPVIAVVTIDGREFMQTKTFSQPSSSSPQTGFAVAVPGSAIAVGARFKIELRDQRDQSFSGSVSGARLAEQDLGAVSANGDLELVIVPFRYGADGSNRLPPVDSDTVQQYRQRFLAMYPAAGVNVRVHEPVPYSSVISRTNGLSTLLYALTDLRRTDGVGSNVFYYGVVAPAATFSDFCAYGCMAGLGWVPGLATSSHLFASVGVSFSGYLNLETALHEVGHNMGRFHAPCGGVASSDPGFPYAGGSIGGWGYDARTSEFVSPSVGTDIMGYCSSQWISDYTYSALFDRLRTVNTSSMARLIGDPIEYRVAVVAADGQISWKPDSWPLDHPMTGNERTVELLDGAGKAVGSVTGHFVGYDHGAGGLLLVRTKDTTMRPSTVRVDGVMGPAW